MQLRYEQLPQHLQKNLAPMYLLSGDVPLLAQEASEAIRAAAQQQGYCDRQVFHVESGFSWPKFLAISNNLSLFANKQLLEIRLPTTQLGDGGSKALQAYAANPPPDKILLITLGKLDSTQQKSTWVQSLIKNGVFIQFWPITNDQLPQWIEKRLAAAGLRAEKTGIELLAASAEGNLLAAVQEIEKLRLLFSTANECLSTETIAQAITDNARFDIFQLADACLQGHHNRSLRILAGLRGEGVEAILVLWSLAREIRVLTQISYQIEAGQPLEQALQHQQVWEKRKHLVRQALKRHTTKSLVPLLKLAGKIDQIIKGLETGNVWNELERLILKI